MAFRPFFVLFTAFVVSSQALGVRLFFTTKSSKDHRGDPRFPFEPERPLPLIKAKDKTPLFSCCVLLCLLFQLRFFYRECDERKPPDLQFDLPAGK
jgi:hypothetical protein